MSTQEPHPPVSPYGRGGLPWWVTFLIAGCVFLPSTVFLTLPWSLSWAPAAVGVVGWFIVMIGVAGGLWATVNSLLCKDFGWWPIPVFLISQWLFALVAYSVVT